ncbi:unnamed protein product [Symbiodinium natans]|uniref:Uncharacterized protein n=1 Tax=Symbiodinium natans TaxID=878477 RepID=A0A812URE7_9DINO|nr:unnamed protein product [Symbiodinium natans]
MVHQWKSLLLLGHFVLLESGRAACQGIIGRHRFSGESPLLSLWPPIRPGPTGPSVVQRTRLSQSALDPRAAFMGSSDSVVYKDLLALLSVAFENQRTIIHQQRSRMDRLLAEFADIRQELEEDPELQMLYAEVRRQRKDGVKKKKQSKKKTKKDKDHPAAGDRKLHEL